MTVGEIIQRVESLLSKGIATSLPGGISRRWIYSMARTYRSKIIAQKANKKQFMSDWMMRTLYCVKLVDANASSCDCLPSLCSVRRTEREIPEIMSDLSGYAIRRITNTTGNINIQLCGRNDFKYRAMSKYSKGGVYCYADGGYLYFMNADNLDAVNITALFDDPVEVDAFNKMYSMCSKGDDNDKCANPLESDFGIDDDMADTIVKLCVQEISAAFLRQDRSPSEAEARDRKEAEDEG
jgi:hypothetical protein